MEALRIEATERTPKVNLDKSLNTFEFIGDSYPENVLNFYKPVLEWLSEYANSPNEETIVTFQLEYFDTSSSKMILDILVKLSDMVEEGYNVKVRWMYQYDDDDMMRAGEEYGTIVDVEIELEGYE